SLAAAQAPYERTSVPMRFFFFTLLVVVFGPRPMSAAVDSQGHVPVTGVGTAPREQLPRSAVLGREACAQHGGVLGMRLDCAVQKKASRNAFVPRAGAKVSLTQGDGSCAYHAVGGALTNAVGKSRAKTVLDLKRRTIAGAIQH
ncbi:unnamed protein product, partial [Pylaiella littoralis]